jgi:hypothetical protein
MRSRHRAIGCLQCVLSFTQMLARGDPAGVFARK